MHLYFLAFCVAIWLFCLGALVGVIIENHFTQEAIKGWRETVDEWEKTSDDLKKALQIIEKNNFV